MTRDNERLFNRIHSNADIHSYRRDDVFIITKALGHNRLDVAINHYLR